MGDMAVLQFYTFKIKVKVETRLGMSIDFFPSSHTLLPVMFPFDPTDGVPGTPVGNTGHYHQPNSVRP